MPKPHRCYQINDCEPCHGDYPGNGTWFEQALAAFSEDAPSHARQDYDLVNVIEPNEYQAYPFGNMECAQGYRHRRTGWTIPDLCRQKGGCPEIWHKTRRRQLQVSPDSPILDYLAHF